VRRVCENGCLIESCTSHKFRIDSRVLMYFIPSSDKWKRKKGRPRISLRVSRDRHLQDLMMSCVTLLVLGRNASISAYWSPETYLNVRGNCFAWFYMALVSSFPFKYETSDFVDSQFQLFLDLARKLDMSTHLR
jgi:hypothetical protein